MKEKLVPKGSSKRHPKAGTKSAAKKRVDAKRRERRKGFDETPAFGFMNIGGTRKGAGRKARLRADGKRVHHTHEVRKGVTRHRPVHVTVNIVAGLPSLRRADIAVHVLAAISGGNQREDFRVVHFSVMSTHVHMICEAHGNKALALGMRGIGGRVAKKVNKVLGRKGRVIADRFHAHVLNTRAEVRNAVRYVLRNAERHDVLGGASEMADVGGLGGSQDQDTNTNTNTGTGTGTEGSSERAWWTGLDPLSSAAAFPYWREAQSNTAGGVPEMLVAGVGATVRDAQCWLFRNAFDGEPLSMYEVLPAARRRVAKPRPGQRTGGANQAGHASVLEC